MKVLVVTNLFPPEFLGGYELGCAHMVEALRSRGHEVLVVTSTSTHAEADSEDVLRVLALAPIYNSPRMAATDPAVREHFHLLSSFVNPANVQALSDVIEEFDPDVAYLWNLIGLGGLGIVAMLRHLGIAWVWHIMDIVPRLLCGIGGDALPPLAREFGALAEGRYVACSGRIAKENCDGGLELGENVHVLPNWVTGERTGRRTEFFAGGGLRVMTAVGVLGEHKGTDILIDAAARLHDLGYGNFSIDVYGREEDPRFRRMLHEQDVGGTVRFMGSVAQPKLLDLYARYDVFAFPTWAREPFAFAPLEAAACGCVPLFPFDCGNAEWMVDGVHCLKAERNADAFAARIVEILRGEVDLGAIGRRAQATVCTDFHIDAVAPHVEALLADAAGERALARGSVGDFHRLVRFADGLLPVLLAEAGR